MHVIRYRTTDVGSWSWVLGRQSNRSWFRQIHRSPQLPEFPIPMAGQPPATIVSHSSSSIAARSLARFIFNFVGGRQRQQEDQDGIFLPLLRACFFASNELRGPLLVNNGILFQDQEDRAPAMSMGREDWAGWEDYLQLGRAFATHQTTSYKSRP